MQGRESAAVDDDAGEGIAEVGIVVEFESAGVDGQWLGIAGVCLNRVDDIVVEIIERFGSAEGVSALEAERAAAGFGQSLNACEDVAGILDQSRPSGDRNDALMRGAGICTVADAHCIGVNADVGGKSAGDALQRIGDRAGRIILFKGENSAG